MSAHQTTSVKSAILILLDERGEIQGAENLAFNELGCFNRTHVNSIIRRLEEQGLVTVSRSYGGRGHKTIIRRRNPNQPGQPRRIKD